MQLKQDTNLLNASPVGIGAILTHFEPKNTENKSVIAYASRLLNETKRRYAQTEREALAVVWVYVSFIFK